MTKKMLFALAVMALFGAIASAQDAKSVQDRKVLLFRFESEGCGRNAERGLSLSAFHFRPEAQICCNHQGAWSILLSR
jgi:hypothetical protein